MEQTGYAVFRRIGTILLFVGPITTLAVSPFSSYDPINLIKLLFINGFAFAVLGLSFFVIGLLRKRLNVPLLVASGFFIFWMILVFVVSDSPKDQQFWGVFGRNTGMLTYFSLIVVLMGASLVQQRAFYHKLVDVLILTGLPTTLYALIQIVGRDPIPWSVKAPFATLGNINFSSAFFGLVAVCACTLAMSRENKLWLRISLALLTLTDLLIVLQTGSIQGFMIFLAGMGVAILLWIRSKPELRIISWIYLVLGFVFFVLTALALGNLGPLARFIFSETVTFRTDYWHAGWEMTLRNPLFGVGLDSYGDYYREMRGEISTLRTGPDRITNTAHNIYLDISSSGGLPLIFAYLVVLVLAGRSAFRVLKSREFNPYFTALVSAWIAYLIQAAVSINQVGVGIWGWLFTGAVIGYERVSPASTLDKSGKKSGKQRNSGTTNVQIPALAAIVGILAFALGLFAGFIPFRADSQFRQAWSTGPAQQSIPLLERPGITAYHHEIVLDRLLRENQIPSASTLVARMKERYPRNFMAFRVQANLPDTSEAERNVAKTRLKELDPFNPIIP